MSIDRYLARNSSLGYEVIVVDNTPLDPGLANLCGHPGLQIIQNPSNLGFARACNIGAKQARGRLLLFLNPDTEFMDASMVNACTWLLNNPKAGVVGCRHIGPNGVFQRNSIQQFPTILNQIADFHIFDDVLNRWSRAKSAVQRPIAVEAVSGAFMLIRKEVFEKVQGFSESYFMYAEDVDLCYKLRKGGYRSYYLASVGLIHYGGASAKTRGVNRFSTIVFRESTFRFFAKHHGKAAAWNYRLVILLSSLARLFVLSIACLLFASWSRRVRNSLLNSFQKWKSASSWALGLEKWVYNL